MRRHFIVIASALVCAVAAGCATPSRPEAMASASQASHRSNSTVLVEVSGGRPTQSTAVPQTSNDDFAKALRTSIEQSGTFAHVATSPPADYRLVAYIGKLESPMMGGAVRVDMEVSYQLIATSSGQKVWSENVRTQHTVPMDAAYAFVDRVRIGNEVAARQSIQRALVGIEALKLP